jgi:hypothetical protein
LAEEARLDAEERLRLRKQAEEKATLTKTLRDQQRLDTEAAEARQLADIQETLRWQRHKAQKDTEALLQAEEKAALQEAIRQEDLRLAIEVADVKAAGDLRKKEHQARQDAQMLQIATEALLQKKLEQQEEADAAARKEAARAAQLAQEQARERVKAAEIADATHLLTASALRRQIARERREQEAAQEQLEEEAEELQKFQAEAALAKQQADEKAMLEEQRLKRSAELTKLGDQANADSQASDEQAEAANAAALQAKKSWERYKALQAQVEPPTGNRIWSIGGGGGSNEAPTSVPSLPTPSPPQGQAEAQRGRSMTTDHTMSKAASPAFRRCKTSD